MKQDKKITFPTTLFSVFKIIFSEENIFYYGNRKPSVQFLEGEDATDFTTNINCSIAPNGFCSMN